MKVWTRFVSVLLLVSLIFVTACGSPKPSNEKNKESDSPKNIASKKEMTITYLTIKNADHPLRLALDEILAEYNLATNSNLKIDYQTTADRGSYNQKLRTLIASNNVPDWFDADPDAYTSKLAKNGYLQDFGAFLDDAGLRDRFQKIALSYQTFDGLGTYLMPTAIDMEVFWYNTKLFSENNISVPKTFEQLLTASATLKQNGVTPIVVSGKEKWPLLRYLAYIPFRLANNDFINDAKMGKQLFNSEIGMKGIEFLHELGTKGYFQEGFATTDYGSAIDYFLSGKAAILNMGSWQFKSFTKEALAGTAVEGDIDYFLMPTVDNAINKPSDIWTSGGVGVGFKKDTFNDKTKDFLSYLISEKSGYVEKLYRLGPIFPAIVSDNEVKTDDLFKKMLSDVANVETGGVSWDVLIDPVTNELMGDLSNALALGSITPEQFAAKIDASVKENASKYFEKTDE